MAMVSIKVSLDFSRLMWTSTTRRLPEDFSSMMRFLASERYPSHKAKPSLSGRLSTERVILPGSRSKGREYWRRTSSRRIESKVVQEEMTIVSMSGDATAASRLKAARRYLHSRGTE